VGRDPKEITCSVHLTLQDTDPLRLADEAASRVADRVDLIVLFVADPYDASMVEPLALAARAN
jgi:hypothetical protein